MKKTKQTSLLITLIIGSILKAQFGINTNTPTEIADVNGTLRVRSLPTPGTTNSIYTTGTNTNSGSNPTQTFNGSTVIASDNNGVLGKMNTNNLVPITPLTDTSNNSTAMFVIKRYAIGDYPTFDTEMSVSKWEPIISNVMFNHHTGNTVPGTYYYNGEFGYQIYSDDNEPNWIIHGDINQVDESSVTDVLFINKNYVSGDNRPFINMVVE